MKRSLTRFRWVGFLVLGLAAGFLWSSTKAAEELGEYDVISFADLGFTAGGMSGRFLFFEQWTASPTIPYPANTVLQHNNQLWVTLTTPGATDEPGTAANWLQLTGGGGATLTQEQVEDFVGAMVDGNTETGITVTYDDTDGTLDFVVTGGGLATVATDATITGDGSAGDPLSVANPFEAADETKLDGIAAGAEVNVQVDWAETDTTSDAFIENKPTIPPASTDDQTAAEVPVTASGFNGNLDTSDTNVQLVAQALDDLVIPMADGVVESATFADATYMVTFDRTVGADVLLDLSAILTAANALAARVTRLEGFHPTPQHGDTRYAALRADGSTAADFTEADFLGAGATSSTTTDIDSPASATDMVVGIAVPSSEGILTEVAELDADGNLNPLASMIRAIFEPSATDTQITLDINSVEHYIYATTTIVFASQLGIVGYRLTQTSP